MESSLNTTANSIINEWGEDIVKPEEIWRMEEDSVLDNIQQNNPAITAVKVNLDKIVGVIDMAAAGQGVGGNTYITFLQLDLDTLMKSS
ncbi:hypothetical protein ACHAXN_004680 [Cyclotella atomus]